MKHIFIDDHLDAIHRSPDDGYIIELKSLATIKQYLMQHGFHLAKIETFNELLETLRTCNESDLIHTLSAPAPRNDLRLLWRNMRRRFKLED